MLSYTLFVEEEYLIQNKTKNDSSQLFVINPEITSAKLNFDVIARSPTNQIDKSPDKQEIDDNFHYSTGINNTSS